MKSRELRIRVGTQKTVGATAALPEEIEIPLGVLLAHGAGNDRFAPLLVHVQRGLARGGVVCITFNFPYKEEGRRLPDPLPVLVDAYRRVFTAVRARFGPRLQGWVIGGKSLGGRVASHLVVEGAATQGLVFLGYPLHPAGKVERLRVDHLRRIAVPMLFVQGTRDALCDLRVLAQLLPELRCGERPLAELAVIEGGDHSFIVPRSQGRSQEEVYDRIVERILVWLRKLAATDPDA